MGTRVVALAVAALCSGAGTVQAQTQAAAAPPSNCPITHDQLANALKAAVKPTGGPSNGGLDNNEWAAIVNRDGKVCAIAFSGSSWKDQWLGSRPIAVEKASTALSFSLDGMALSTANLYAGAQPEGFLFGIGRTNPPNNAIYEGDAEKFGTDADPVLGRRIGGLVTFGGGLALYNNAGLIGGLGVSGDTSCADHNVAWRMRHALNLDHAQKGPDKDKKDAIIYDIGLTGASKSGYGHPKCAGKEADIGNEIGATVSGGLLR
ncbi:MAG: heme-binding protein [Methylobacteriaceae bacterium]|nr:heme-binding protein [Methylobacteriaceae bacterium]